MNKKILLGHGSGGKLSHELITSLFVKHFDNSILQKQSDSAILNTSKNNKLAYTTDSYVVDPIFFPGGNIGKLAVCGTLNDLSVSGAKPLYISSAFIIEEGFEIDKLEEIIITMADEAKKANVSIVTGDTKVVDKGKCDKVFINTSGIGSLDEKYNNISFGKDIKVGDAVIINGDIGDHGMIIMSKRNNLNISSDLKSDCANLYPLIKEILSVTDKVKFMRDATRGGLATVLCEVAENTGFTVELEQDSIPIKDSVNGICEIFGFDPIYVANEGKVVIIVDSDDADKVLNVMKNHHLGKKSAIIGKITNDYKNKVVVNTEIGGKRIVDMLSGEQLPRIC